MQYFLLFNLLTNYLIDCLITFDANERKHPHFLCTMLLYSSLIYIFFSHPAPPRDRETYVLSCFIQKKIIKFLCHRAQLFSVSSHNDQNCFHSKKIKKNTKKLVKDTRF